MPASSSTVIDPIASALKRTFASAPSSVSGMNGSSGLIRGGSSSPLPTAPPSALVPIQPSPLYRKASGETVDPGLPHLPSSAAEGSSSASTLELGIAAGLKRSVLSVAGGIAGVVQYDNPTRYLAGNGAASSQANGKTKYIILNPQLSTPPPAATPKANANGSEKKSETDSSGKAEVVPKPKVEFFKLSSVEVGYKVGRSPGGGMENLGNTCFLNSTLQALFHTPALFNYLTSGAHEATSNCNKLTTSFNAGFGGVCLVCAMSMTLKDSLRTARIRPKRILDRLKSICKTMMYGQQEDAHEFLVHLIEELGNSFLRASPVSALSLGPFPGVPAASGMMSAAALAKSLDHFSRDTTPFHQIFGYLLRQDVQCLRCKRVSTSYQPDKVMPVNIEKSATIEAAIDNYFAPERIGGGGGGGGNTSGFGSFGGGNTYRCESCKTLVAATKRFRFQRPPAVLCIQLKRFGLNGKITRPVRLSRQLNLTSYVHTSGGVNPASSGGPISIRYRLVSLIHHIGISEKHGHYIAMAEAASGQFFEFNDERVRPISINDVLNTPCYVVIYEMTRDSWQNALRSLPHFADANGMNGQHLSNDQHVRNKPQPPPLQQQQQQNLQQPRNCSGNGSNGVFKANNSQQPGIRPKLIEFNPSAAATTNQPSSMNKLGIVTGAAKNAMAAAAASIVRTVSGVASAATATPSSGTSSKKVNDNKVEEASNGKASSSLVGPYGTDDSGSSSAPSDEDERAAPAARSAVETSVPSSSSVPSSPFIPRAVAVNALIKTRMADTSSTNPTGSPSNCKETTSAAPGSSSVAASGKVIPVHNGSHDGAGRAAPAPFGGIERRPSSSGVWTVTDLEQHSVNSDNSTGSTSGAWVVKKASSGGGGGIEAPASTAAAKRVDLSSDKAREDEDDTGNGPSRASTAVRTSTASSSTSSFTSVSTTADESAGAAEAAPGGTVRNKRKQSFGSCSSLKTGDDDDDDDGNDGVSVSAESDGVFSAASSSTTSASAAAGRDEPLVVSPRKRCHKGLQPPPPPPPLTAVNGNRLLVQGEGYADDSSSYDAEFDRGRTKKVRKCDANLAAVAPSNIGGKNPFQMRQNALIDRGGVLAGHVDRRESSLAAGNRDQRQWGGAGPPSSTSPGIHRDRSWGGRGGGSGGGFQNQCRQQQQQQRYQDSWGGRKRGNNDLGGDDRQNHAAAMASQQQQQRRPSFGTGRDLNGYNEDSRFSRSTSSSSSTCSNGSGSGGYYRNGGRGQDSRDQRDHHHGHHHHHHHHHHNPHHHQRYFKR